jgi:mono/diheme cytochrome c family protein/plastocyanin
MSDTPERPPEGEPEQRLPVPREPAEPAPIERFTSPPAIRNVDFPPERAAQVVRQSSNARWVGFLAVVVVILFITIYWFYELAPLGILQPRLDAEATSQAIVAVERGYNLYEANCARCHGKNGEGGIGPALNRQDKLFAHLSVDYLNNMLFAGGRYACGNPNSLMPIWSNAGNPPGPLNYIQIEDIISFIRAPNTQTYTVRDPELGEPQRDPVTNEVKTFKGWVDPNYKPAPGATPFPACWADEFAQPSAAPSGPAGSPGASPGGSPAASEAPSGEKVTITASGIQFTTKDVTAPVGKPFVLSFDNQDASVPHDVQIKKPDGTVVFTTDVFPGVATKEFTVPALTAGPYPFVCTVHPNMTGTITAQ